MERRGRALTNPWKAVLFDVEGVIAHRDEAATEAELDARWPGLSSEDVHRCRNTDRLYPLWTTLSRGLLSSSSYWAAVLADLGVEVTDQSVDDMRAIQERTAWAVVDDEVLTMARQIRDANALQIGILSNSSIDYERHIRGFESDFDVVCFSHRTGRRKPDADAYLGAAAALGVEATSIVFFDDKPRNIAAAEAAGITAYLVIDAASVQRALAELGLLGGAS